LWSEGRDAPHVGAGPRRFAHDDRYGRCRLLSFDGRALRLRERHTELIRRAGVAILAGTLAAGCARSRDRSGPTPGDSAGVRIVENPIPPDDAPAPFTIDPDPSLDLGSANGPPETNFNRIAAVRLVRGGGLIVADEGVGALRAFDLRRLTIFDVRDERSPACGAMTPVSSTSVSIDG